LSVAGARATSNNYTLDGVGNTGRQLQHLCRASLGRHAAGIQGSERRISGRVRPRCQPD
jgi:hypothetical protein